MGMRQRLGLAATLLGDPRVLILDEPANGLDPEGIRWLRGFFAHMAEEGRTVLVSSHQLAEIQAVADRVVILSRGRLVTSGSIAELSAGRDTALVRGPNLQPLAEELAKIGGAGEWPDANTLRIRGLSLQQVGHAAFAAGVELHELSEEKFDLEQLFFTLTQGEYAAPTPGAGGPPPGYQGGPPGYQGGQGYPTGQGYQPGAGMGGVQ
jgi:ABC-2 type transport system ATP-binding protein